MNAEAWLAFAALSLTMVLALVAFAFMLGVLSQRVKSLEDQRSREAGLGDRLVRLETLMEGFQPTLESINTHIVGLQRQVGNLASKRLGGAGEA
jgi:hypothetical protein